MIFTAHGAKSFYKSSAISYAAAAANTAVVMIGMKSVQQTTELPQLKAQTLKTVHAIHYADCQCIVQVGHTTQVHAVVFVGCISMSK